MPQALHMSCAPRLRHWEVSVEPQTVHICRGWELRGERGVGL